MILGEKLEGYSSSEVNTPCFNQKLSEKAFERIGYYKSAGIIFGVFQKTNPTYIMDELGIMPQLEHRYPYLEETTRKLNSGIYAKINN